MKITKLELMKVKPRWMFLKMYTDTDIIGLGEPILEGHCNAVEAVIREFEDYLIGKDPMMIEHHVQALYRGGFYRGGPVTVLPFAMPLTGCSALAKGICFHRQFRFVIALPQRGQRVLPPAQVVPQLEHWAMVCRRDASGAGGQV